MKQQIKKIVSQYDGLTLEMLIFEPEKEPKGMIQISHGMAEHKERYEVFMKFLCDHGYIVVIHDHRGHGKSIKNPEDLGFFYDDSAEAIVEDLHQITLFLKEKYADLSCYLFGHSMGSLVVRKYIKKYDQDIDKLIVCGSPSENPLTAFAVFLVKFLKYIKGEHFRSYLIQKLAFGTYNKGFKEGNSTNRWISADQENVEQYDRDKLCGFVFTLNGFQNLFLLMKDIYSLKGWQKQNLDLPILFIAGEADPVIISPEKWQESQTFLKTIGYQNVEGILYQGMRHEILMEKEKQKVFQDVLNWIDS